MLSHDWPIEAIHPNRDNPRRHLRDDPEFPGLVASIRNQGILQPLLINAEGMILAGHRRYEAALEIGLQRIPVRVLPPQNNHSLVPLIENLQRADLKVLEVADYLAQCRKEHGMTVPAISEIAGISGTTIRQYIKLAEAPSELRERIERDDITLGAALAMLARGGQLIQELVHEPNLTRNSVRAKAKVYESHEPERRNDAPPDNGTAERSAPRLVPVKACPTETRAHLRYAISIVNELLAASPDDDFQVRYKRWIKVMEDDLSDLESKEPATTFRGSIDMFQRQPKSARAS